LRRPGYHTRVVGFYTKRKKVRPIILRVEHPARLPRPVKVVSRIPQRPPDVKEAIKVSDRDKDRLIAARILQKHESAPQATKQITQELKKGKIDLEAANLSNKQARQIIFLARKHRLENYVRYHEQEMKRALARGGILVSPKMERALARELKDRPAIEFDPEKTYVTRTMMGHQEFYEAKRSKNGKVELDYRGRPQRDYEKQIPTIKRIEDISFNGKYYDAGVIRDILRRGVNKHRALFVSKNNEGDLVMKYSDGTTFEPHSREPGSWEKTRVSLENLLKGAAA
jgi:predicted kinase